MTDSLEIRNYIRLVESSTNLDEALNNLIKSGELDEAFGVVPVGQLISFGFKSVFNPQAKFKFFTGVYANSLYSTFKKTTGNETPTGQDILDYFTSAITSKDINRLGQYADKFADTDDAIGVIIQRVSGSTNFNEQLSPNQVSRIFAEVGATLGRKAMGTSARLIKQASDAQEQKVLQIMTKIRPFLSASSSTLSLNKFTKWVEANGELAGANKKAIIRYGFANYIKLLRTASATPIPLLPTPFVPNNSRPMSQSEIAEFIGQLDNILLEIIIADDKYVATKGATPTPTPTPTPPAPTRTDVEQAIDDWIGKGYDAATIQTLLGMKII